MATTSMRGRIAEWNDARGFGFIDGPGARGRVFVHIKDFDTRAIRPSIGDDVAYLVGVGRDGRPAAKSVRILSAKPANAIMEAERVDAPMRVTVRIVGALVVATVVLCCVLAGRASIWLLLCYVVGGVVSFVAYWQDKRAAIRGTWRTMEESLHFFDVAFGIGGGLLAQGVLRHKSSKRVFGIVTGVVFAVHMAMLGLLLAGYGPTEWMAWLTA